MLIHYGVVNKIVWIRLGPKHSHNLANRANSMVEEDIWPHTGVGGECMAPWDYEGVMVERAMKAQLGNLELAWHWANWDFKQYVSGYVGDFSHFANKRVWVYENTPELEGKHGGVRITWKRGLLPPERNNAEPEYKPIGMGDEGVVYTLPEGQLFMDSYPPLDTPPPREVWKAAEYSTSGERALTDAARGVGAKPWKKESLQ